MLVMKYSFRNNKGTEVFELEEMPGVGSNPDMVINVENFDIKKDSEVCK